MRSLALVVFAAFAMTWIPPPARAAEPDLREAATRIRHAAGAHRLLLLGELHGTREIPQVVRMLVEAYARDAPVTLGLEIPLSEQALIDRYIDSDGNPAARAALRQGAFWQVRGVQHDGRRNMDMLELIERMRQLRHRGHGIAILAFDDAPGAQVGSEARDQAMAERLRAALRAKPGMRLIALAGNVHAMRRRPENAPAEMQASMGSRLLDLDPFSVDISAQTGQFWACPHRCGPEDVHARGRSGPSSDGVYDYEIVLPRLSIAHLIGAED